MKLPAVMAVTELPPFPHERCQMRKIFIHAGLHKTGTTSFQNFCRYRRADLRARGLHYARLDFPGALDHPNHSFVVRHAYTAALQGDNAPRQDLLRELGRQFESCDRMLLSAEDICSLPEAGKMLLLQDARLLADELCFLFLVRHPRSYFQSAIQEHVKGPRGVNFFDVPDDRLRAIIAHEWSTLFTSRLGFFRSRLLDEELIVRTYEEAHTSREGVIGYLLENCLRLRLPPGACRSMPSSNASLSHETVLLVSALKGLGLDATNVKAAALPYKIYFGHPLGGCRHAFASAVEHRLPPISGELEWLKVSFGIDYDPDAVVFDRIDLARLWSPNYITSLLGFARDSLDRDERLLVAAALDFVAAQQPVEPPQAEALAAASRQLRSSG